MIIYSSHANNHTLANESICVLVWHPFLRPYRIYLDTKQTSRNNSINGPIRKKNTLTNYDFLFTRFTDEFGNRKLKSITPDEILSFLTRLTKGTKQTTKRNRYSCLKAFFNYIRNTIARAYIQDKWIENLYG